jgi:hypothetical protein
MKYNKTQSETQAINEGRIITMACYKAKNCALAEHIANYNGVKYKFEQSESPTGKGIFIFYFYPDTYYKAFRIGSMAERPELYEEEVNKLVATWEKKFQSLVVEKKPFEEDS